ncbi:MAG TPA: type II secretion system protein N [Burkholderiales bacterium]|jgi:general secretion pathway protein C
MMEAISLERSSPIQTAIVSLATFAALALLGLVLAYWTWTWLAPDPEPRAAVQAGNRVAGSAAGPPPAVAGLFGNAGRDQTGAARTGTAIGLLGVVAARKSRPEIQSGYAVLRLDAKQTIVVREGGEIEPGVRLAEVHADHVVLERGGVRETLAWPQQGKSAPSPAPVAGK